MIPVVGTGNPRGILSVKGSGGTLRIRQGFIIQGNIARAFLVSRRGVRPFSTLRRLQYSKGSNHITPSQREAMTRKP